MISANKNRLEGGLFVVGSPPPEIASRDAEAAGEGGPGEQSPQIPNHKQIPNSNTQYSNKEGESPLS